LWRRELLYGTLQSLLLLLLQLLLMPHQLCLPL
jgi:hypothetical protein